MKYLLTLCLILLAAATNCPAATRLQSHSAKEFFTPVHLPDDPLIRQNTGRYLALDAGKLQKTIERSSAFSLTDFPVSPTQDGTLDLKPAHSVMDSRTQVLVGTENGDVPASLPDIISMRGSIRGEAGSSVFLNFVNSEIIGMIERADGQRYVLAPSNRTGAQTGEHLLIAEHLFSTNGVLPMNCMGGISAGAQKYQTTLISPTHLLAATNKLLELNIAIEADNDFLQRTGGTVPKATAYIASLFAMISSIFEDEVNVTFHIPWVKVWAAPDPYQAKGNGYAMFDTVPRYWKTHYDNVQRDLVHVMTASEWGGGGIGFRGEAVNGGISVLCSKEYGYGESSPRGVLSYPTFAFTYDAYIIAHEIGHNFAAHHTHDCWWNPALDTCQTQDDPKYPGSDACFKKPIVPKPNPGSLMSYCGSINYDAGGGVFEAFSVRMTFLPKVAALLRQEAELSCITEPKDPIVILTNPRGAVSSIPADTVVHISWTSAHIANVALQYSLDNGKQWKTITPSVLATSSPFSWKVPKACSDGVVIRIADAGQPAIADTSLLAFTMISPTLKPDIIAQSATSFCAGDSVVLDAGKYASYAWSDGSVERTITVKGTGVYSVTVTDTNGCSGASAEMNVVVYPTPMNPSIVQHKDSLMSSPAASYQWYRDGKLLAGETRQSLVPGAPGAYTVIIEDEHHCSATSSPFIFSNTGVSEELSFHTLAIFPNPANEQCVVELFLPVNTTVEILLMDVLGRQMLTVSGKEAAGKYSRTISLEHLPPGVYGLTVRADGKIYTEMLTHY